jgi:hypothetical protein
MPRGDKLTPKQRKLIKGIAEGKPQKTAAKAAGLNESYASQVLNEPKVKLALADLMEKAGLSDDVLLAKHVELLNAQKTISAIGSKEANGGTVDFVDVPDYQTQKGALEMAYKLKGAFIDKQEVKHSGEIIQKIERVVVRPNGNATNSDR